MPALLRIIDGPQAGESCEIRQGQRLLLGRGEESDFHILDSWASREHCAIHYDQEGLHVEDLETKNGTYLSGRRVDKARLHDGALVQVGTTTVQVLLRPTSSTVVAMTVPMRQRATRAGLYVAAGVVVLVGVVAAAIHVFSRGGEPGKQGNTTGVTWSGSDRGKNGGAFSLLGGQSRKVAVTLTSEPSGATVFIDDEFRGATPLNDVEVAVGEHTLRVQKAGYEVYRGSLVVDRRTGEPIHFVLKLVERGALVLSSKPDGAQVFLDGEYRGKTPLRLNDLDPQTYTLRLVKPNFADWTREVTIRPTEVVTVEATLGQREIGFYLAALAKDPNNVSYHTELAHLYLLEHKVDECVQHLTLAIDITVAGRDTTRPEPYTARMVWLISKIYFNDHFHYGDEAFVRMMQGRIDQLLAEAAGKHPNSSTVLSIAQKLYKRAGTPHKMVPIYLKQAEAQPTTFAHYASAVALLQQAGRHEEAAKVLEKAAGAIPNDYRVYLELGRAHLAAKRAGARGARERAIQALNLALQKCGDEAGKREIRRLLGKATE